MALGASPRKGGNSDLLLDAAIAGARDCRAAVEKYYVCDLHINPCRGCLRCNVLGRCAIAGDDWADFAQKFLAADGVLIAAPVYFWYVPGTLKVLVDRCRSLIHVTMGPEHITCAARDWKPKNFAFILVQGEPTGNDHEGALQMLRMFAERMGRGGRVVGELIAKGPALKGQVGMSKERLSRLFAKVGLPTDAKFVASRHKRYQGYLAAARRLGAELAAR